MLIFHSKMSSRKGYTALRDRFLYGQAKLVTQESISLEGILK